MDIDDLRAAVERQKRLLPQPVDFAQLERDGILRKVGQRYEVASLHDLPEHVRLRIKDISHVRGKAPTGFELSYHGFYHCFRPDGNKLRRTTSE